MDKVKNEVITPAFIIEEELLLNNLKKLQYVQEQAGIDIILALKAFSVWKLFPLVKQYLKGATASSLNEALLIHEEMGVKAHSYAPVYPLNEFEAIANISSHITFNSIQQYHYWKANHPALSAEISCGIRINPEYSEVETEMYNPCADGSRLGEVVERFNGQLPDGIDGLHFHALCESNSYSLEKTIASFENLFGDFLPQLKWVNMGGGHFITKDDYDKAHLIQLLKAFKKKWDVDVILEPGSAVAVDTGTLWTTILDIHESRGIKTLMIDASFTAHMPDTLEMPYRPQIVGASLIEKENYFPYRIGGNSCLSGDYMFEYWFEKPLKVGDQLIFKDMIHYTIVKTTMFNGVAHPSILLKKENGSLETLKSFTYQDYKNRMA